MKRAVKYDQKEKQRFEKTNTPIQKIAKLISNRKYGHARRMAEKLAKDSSDGKFLCEVGVLFARLGRYSSAGHMFKTALELSPEESAVHYNYGLYLKAKKDLKTAEIEFRQAVKLESSNSNYHCMLGNTLLEQGNIEGSEEEFIIALELDPKNLFALTGLGNIAIKNGQFEDAEKIFKKLIKINRDYPVPYMSLFLLYTQQGRLKEAKKIQKLAEKVKLKMTIEKP